MQESLEIEAGIELGIPVKTDGFLSIQKITKRDDRLSTVLVGLLPLPDASAHK